MKAKKANLTQACNKPDVYNVENCFKFDEEDPPKQQPKKNLHSTAIAQPKTIEFRPDKPYRLALYVQPASLKRRMEQNSSTVLANLSRIKKSKNKENKIAFPEQASKTKQKINVALFDEEGEVTKNEKSSKQNSVVKKESTLKESNAKMVQKNILSYTNVTECQKKKSTTEVLDTSSLPKTKQKKMRRSYEKKFKEYMDSEKIVEPPSEEILKEIDIKKISKTKQKKTSKEEKEFEEWAENMNSAFDDIDKFELSINYG